MNRKGVEFTVSQVDEDCWNWRFQIGETVTTGTTKTVLVVKAKSAQIRINRVLKVFRAINRNRTDRAGLSDAP